MSIELMMPSKYLIICHPLLLLPSVFSRIRVFPGKLALCVKWPKYWSFDYSISPFNERSGLISFRIDRFNLLAVQGTLKSLLQHHSSKVSVLSFLYGPTLTSVHDYWKNHQFSLVAQLCPTLCDQPYGLHHARLPCPSSTPRACPNSCALSQ